MIQTAVTRALVTGASSGIGTEFARLLAKRKIDLVIASRNVKKLNDLKKELTDSYGVRVDVIQSDLSRAGAAKILFTDCRKKKLDIDLLINNAGTGLFGKLTTQDPSELEGMVTLNDVSLTVLCGLFGAEMAKKKKGRILNVGSLVGHMSLPYFASYAASKSYVYSLSIALNRELKDRGVQVTCLLPGYVSTQFDNNSKVKGKGYRAFSEMNAMKPEKVARIGLNGLFRKKTVVTPGFRNQFFSVIVRLLPKTWIAWLLQTSLDAMVRE